MNTHEDRPWGTVVVHCDRRVEIPIAHGVEDWREGLVPDKVGLRRHLRDRRCHVVGVGILTLQCSLPAGDGAAVLQGCGKRRLHGVEGLLIDQWTEQGAVVEGRTDRHLGVGLLEPSEQFVADILVHDQAAQRGAALARRAEQDTPHRKVEVGGRRHDHAVVTAELEQGPAQAPRHDGGQGLAHAAASGRADERQPWIGGEPLAEVAATDH